MNIFPIETGFFSTDGGAMFGLVPRKIWMRKYPADEENRCPMAMRCLLVMLPGRNILFDTGRGTVTVPGLSYYRFTGETSLSASLATHGLKPEDITDVVLSHLHFDHCGGSVIETPEGLKPAFPNAVYRVGAGQLASALKPSRWEKDAFVPALIQTLLDCNCLITIDHDCELIPGISLRLFQGHTTDQLVSFIDDGQKCVVFCSDVIPLEPHLNTSFLSPVDNSALVSLDEKIRLLEMLSEERSVVFFYHDVFTQAVRIRKQGDKVFVRETTQLIGCPHRSNIVSFGKNN